jgi:plastocyanin
MKNTTGTFIVVGLIAAVALVGCATPRQEVDGPNPVRMNNTRFVPESASIKVGETVTLVAETPAPHFIANGTWAGNQPRSERESGAPEVPNLKIDGNKSGTVGPFAQAGTYQLYCTIHPGMNLTVTATAA